MDILICPEDLHSTFPRSVPWEADLYEQYHLDSLALCLPVVFIWPLGDTSRRSKNRKRKSTGHLFPPFPPWPYVWKWPHFSTSLGCCWAASIPWAQAWEVLSITILSFPLGPRGGKSDISYFTIHCCSPESCLHPFMQLSSINPFRWIVYFFLQSWSPL